MSISDPPELDSLINQDPVRLLAWNVPNEVLRGLRIDSFEQVIGLSKTEFEELESRIHSKELDDQVHLSITDARPFINALEVVLQELGEEEFHTRTGCTFAEGQKLLRDLSSILNHQPNGGR